MIQNRKIWLAVALVITGCGGSDSGGSSGGGDSTTPGIPYDHISIEQSYEMMIDSDYYCGGAQSKWRTEHFIVGHADSDSVSDQKLKDIIGSAQVQFEEHMQNYGWDAYLDLGVDYTNPLEICVKTSEGSGGAGDKEGFIIGTGRSGSNLDTLIDHEMQHTYQNIFVGDTGLGSVHVWYAEAHASRLTSNKQASESEMNTFISQTGMNPTQVTHEGHQLTVTQSLSDGSIEYKTYNSVFTYLFNNGVSSNDIWEVFRRMGEIEESCRIQAIAAREETKNYNEPYVVGISADTSSRISACSGYPKPTKSDSDNWVSGEFGAETYWNGKLVRSGIDDHVTPNDEPGQTKFEIAFNEVMAPYGIDYDSIATDFRNTVMSNIY
ncbi:hypothetical protein BK411_04270 [Vibrio splendidus]|nr:hypothetical protein BK411_04270 [Vibrio splendidus]